MLSAYSGTYIPFQYIVALVECAMNLSHVFYLIEIGIPTVLDTDASLSR